MAGEWRKAIPPEEWAVYNTAGLGTPGGFGSRPALVIIDVQYRTVGDEPLPIMESIAKYYRTSCGQDGWDAIHNLEPVLAAARKARIPIVYPYIAPKSPGDAGRMAAKIPSLMEIPPRGYEFVAEIAPVEGDLLIPKRHSSSFFGTPLASYLIDLGVDTLLMTGCTTSGCVRGTTMDAVSYNFRVGVIEDCCYDRSRTAHNVNLFDINSKYADVIASDGAIQYIEGIEAAKAVGAGAPG